MIKNQWYMYHNLNYIYIFVNELIYLRFFKYNIEAFALNLALENW